MKKKNLTENSNDLPVWAQDEIRGLQNKLKWANDELDRINDNPKSNTIIGSSYSMNNEKIKYLRPNQRITFVLEFGEIQAYINDGIVEIYATGGTDLFIRPKVSNVVQLHLKK